MCNKMGNMHIACILQMKVMVLSRKSTYTILVAAELAGFCERPFLFERSSDRLQCTDTSIWQTFFWEMSKWVSHSRKTTENVCCQQ